MFPELDKPPKSSICKTIWWQTGRHMMSSKKVCQPSAEEYNKCVGSVLEGWEIWVLPRKQENWIHSDSQRLVHGHDSRERSHRPQALTPPHFQTYTQGGLDHVGFDTFHQNCTKVRSQIPQTDVCPTPALAAVSGSKMLGSSSQWNLLDPLSPRCPTHCTAFPKHTPKTSRAPCS